MGAGLGWSAARSSDAAHWLHPYPYPWAGRPDHEGWLSADYPHVLRILHPTWNQDHQPTVEVTWAEIAAARGIELEGGASLYDVVGDLNPSPYLDGVFDIAYWQGTLPPHLHRALLEHLTDASDGLIWDGAADFNDDYYAVCKQRARDAMVQGGRGDLTYFPVTLTNTDHRPVLTSRSPSFWWPTDHSWVAATGIDEFDTLIVSASKTRLEPIHHDPRFETLLYTRGTTPNR